MPGGGVSSSRASTRLRNAVSYLTGLPDRDWSPSPLSPHSEKRWRHLVTVGMETLQLPRHLLNLLALQASQNDPGTLHRARFRNPTLRDGYQTRLVFGRALQFRCMSGHTQTF
jgi:hypothetical protein